VLFDGDRGLPEDGPWEELTCAVIPVEPPVLALTSSLAHPARVVGVFEIPPPHRGAFEPLDAPVVYLDGVRDPGNVGTALRSAAAFDAAGLVIGPDTADPLGAKAVRASMGAVFTVSWRRAEHVQEIAGDRPIVALDAGGGRTIDHVQLAGRVAPVLCIGGERDGLSNEVRTAAEVVASIPIGDGAESLNAAMACTVALYESRRGTR
jgi:TrmH family RNA methyltransferase